MQRGTGDCASCHTNVGVSWAGGQMAHSPVPTSATVVTALKGRATTLLPAGATADLYHSSTFNGTADCVGCHLSVQANLGATGWRLFQS